MSKPVWACPLCAEDFTRKSSAERHTYRLHNGRILPVRYIDYLAGRQSGQYQPPITPQRLLGRKYRTVVDSSRGNISYKNDFETNSRSEHIAVSLYITNPSPNPVVEAVRDFIDVKKTYNRLPVPIDISFAKPLGFRAYVCNLCLSGATEAVWDFVKDGSLTKVDHICNPEAVIRLKPLPEDKKKASHDESFRILVQLVRCWIGQGEASLIAERLPPTEFGTAERPASDGDYVDLGDLKENHCADRAIRENEKTITAMGTITIDESEIRDFLSIAMATFAVFRIKNADGSTRDYFLYIVNGLGSYKSSPLKGLTTKCINDNNGNIMSHQTDLYKAIQFVDGGSIYRWDKLDSMYKNKLSVQIQEWSKNTGGYCFGSILHTPNALSSRKDVKSCSWL
jgi:hypothetical protein